VALTKREPLLKRVTFPTQAATRSRRGATSLHCQSDESERGRSHADFPMTVKGKEALGDHLVHCFPILLASVFTHAANDVFFTGVPGVCQSQTRAPCLIGCF